MKIQTRRGVVSIPRIIFSTYAHEARRRRLRLMILKKPKQPLEEGECFPAWLDLQFPSPYLTYYRILIGNNSCCRAYTWAYGFRVGAREYTVIPVRLLKLMSRIFEVIRKVSEEFRERVKKAFAWIMYLHEMKVKEARWY